MSKLTEKGLPGIGTNNISSTPAYTRSDSWFQFSACHTAAHCADTVQTLSSATLQDETRWRGDSCRLFLRRTSHIKNATGAVRCCARIPRASTPTALAQSMFMLRG